MNDGVMVFKLCDEISLRLPKLHSNYCLCNSLNLRAFTMRQNLYMLAIMPPAALTDEIEHIRHEFAEKYKAVAALKPPVHITLIPPYKTFPQTEQVLMAALQQWASKQDAFPVVLKDYDFFPGNGVVFIDVVRNDRLGAFRKELRQEFLKIIPASEAKRSSSFHPHITIGYRDIPRELFPDIEREYSSRQFSAEFIADAFYLWRHTGQRWETIQSFPLISSGISRE